MMTQSNLTFTENHEIPEGYKKTEVGIIPNDWTVESLQNLCRSSITYGIVQCGPHIPNGIPYIRVSDMNSSELNVDEMLRTSPEIASSFGRSKVEEGDIVYALRGKLGEVKMVGTVVSGANLTQGTARIAPKNNIDNRYLLWTLRSPQALKQAVKEAKGSTFVEITLGNLKGISVPLPSSREEQQKIATALSDTDALISELEKLIEKKQAIKTATMQQLLTGKTRLPEFTLREDGTPKAYKNSELGQIPEDWDVYKVGEISDVLTGFPFPSSHYTDSGVRLLRGSNVKRGVTDWSEDITQYWPIISSDIKKYELKVGDIVISMDGSLVGRSFAQLDKSDLPAVLLQRVARVRSSDVDQNYLKQWICSEMFTAHCDAVKTVTAIPHISPDDIKTFRFVAPKCKKEQKQLSGILKDMEVEIQILNEKLTKLIMFKKGMMQELLTGKTRLV